MSTRSDHDFDEEIAAHVALEIDRLRAEGLSEEAARAAAHRAFGNVTRARERFYERGRWLWLDHLRQDVRYAVRRLRAAPGFTAIVVLTMAIGIGATTAIFSVVDATLLHPLPYPHAEQLVSLQANMPGVGASDVGLSEPEWQDLQHSGIFDAVSPAWFDENNLTGAALPERVRLLLVAPNYFALLGVPPQLGRTFDPRDHSPGILPEVVISDGLWTRSFGADPHVLGRTLRMDTDVYRIIGVMPAGFDAPGRSREERDVEIWAGTSFYGKPMSDHPRRAGRSLPTAIARLAPGLTIDEAQRRVDALTATLRRQYPGDYLERSQWELRLLPLKDRVVGDVRQSLVLLFGAVGLVWLIASVNVANLLLARAGTRGREMAMRQALGAARTRLVGQLLTESVLLSALGGLTGLVILFAAKDPLLHLIPAALPRINDIGISWSVLGFAIAASLATGVIFGLAPALNAGRFELTDALRADGRGATASRGQARTRQLLVVAEFALSLTLMVAAGLLLRSFWDLVNVQPGFDANNVMSVRTRMPYPNDPSIDKYPTAAAEAPFFHELLRRVRTLPGVEDAAIGDTASIPLDEALRQLKLISEGQLLVTFDGRAGSSEPPRPIERSAVTPEYFQLLGIPLLRGRLFADSDIATSPSVAVVNEAFARTYWPSADPIGKRFRSTRPASPWITVVGVIANARTESLSDAGVPKAYLDLYQDGGKHLAIFLRGRLNAAAIPDAVRQQVQAIDPALPVFGAQMLDEVVAASLAARRFSMEMVALFGLTALVLAALGIYGVISYMVTARTREIGIRLALGAGRRTIVYAVLRQGLALTCAGAAAGVICAVIVARVMSGALFGVRPTDPPTFALVALIPVAVALAACYVPARRAIRVDPLVVLKSE